MLHEGYSENNESFECVFNLTNLNCLNFAEMQCILHVCFIIWCNQIVQMSFLFYENCFSKILPQRLCCVLQSKFAHYFAVIFSKNSNLVYLTLYNTSIVINKDHVSFKQRFGFVEYVKQDKSVKVLLPPWMGILYLAIAHEAKPNELHVLILGP